MSPEEAKKLADRLKVYQSLERGAAKLAKVSRTLEAIINSEDHEIASIEFNIRKGTIRYKTDRNVAVGTEARACAFTVEDEKMLQDEFVVWARDRIEADIRAIEAKMKEV